MATLTGTAGNDVLTGTAADDVITGGAGNDTLTGGGGHNQFVFDPTLGQVTITDFHPGLDQIVLNGLSSTDVVEISRTTVTDGNSVVHQVSFVSIDGHPGLITVLDASLNGPDLAVSGGASVSLFGKPLGTGAADVLVGGDNRTTIWGWDGDDQLTAGNQATHLLGGAGNDTLTGGSANDFLDGDYGGIDPITPGNDILHAGGGDDILVSEGGDDTLDGGSGRDIADLLSATHAIHIDLSVQGVAQDTGIGMMTLVSIEGVHVGSAFDDVVTAAGLSTGVEIGLSGQGHGTAIGGSGDDNILSLTGSNTLTGGAGRDVFGISTSGLSSPADHSMVIFDTITDFQTGVDALVFHGKRVTIVNNPGGGAVVYADTDGDGVDDTKVVLSTGSVQMSDMNSFQETVVDVATSGDDLIAASFLNRTANGGANYASYVPATAGVHVSLALQGQAQDTIGSGHDTLLGILGVIGSAFGDVLEGDGEQNTMTGGGGADVFVFKPDPRNNPYAFQTNHGADTVTDFSHAQGDRLDVSAFGLSTLQQIKVLAHQSGSDAVLTLGADRDATFGVLDHNSVTLKGVQVSALTAADFILAPAHAAYLGGSSSGLAFRNVATGDWGFMTAGPSGQVWHGVGATSVAYGAIGVGDFNADGVADIAFRNTTTGAWGFMTAGSAGGEVWHDVGSTSTAYAPIGVADFNDDGLGDIAFRNTTTGDWGYMTANPGGGQTWHSAGSASLAYSVIGVGDFNLDGWTDIAFRNNATGDWGFMTADPGYGQVWTAVGPSSTSYAAIGSGDFNGDGVADIAFRNTTTGDWGFMTAAPGGGQVWHGAGSASTAYAAVSTGDFNGDGRAHIAFSNAATGDWGFMSFDVSAGEIWHPMGVASTAYAAIA